MQECGLKRLSLRVSGEDATLTVAAPWQARDLDPSMMAAACGLDHGDVRSSSTSGRLWAAVPLSPGAG